MRILLLLSFTACQSSVDMPVQPVPDALLDAHEAWVERDLSELVLQVHTTLAADPERHVRDNALALLERAFQERPMLPAQQTLPPGVRGVSLDHIHRVGPDGHRFRLVVGVHVESVETLTSVELRGPSALPTPQFSVTEEEGGAYAELLFEDGPTPPEPGLYTIELRQSSGVHRLWAILTGDTASEAPIVLSPFAGQIVEDDRPWLRFTPEATPEYADGETVSMGLWVARRPTFEHVWSRHTDDVSGAVQLDTRLADGEYWLALTRRERRGLGPVRVSRLARRGVPFSVRHGQPDVP